MSSRSRRFKSMPDFFQRWRAFLAQRMNQPWARALAWVDLMIMDHGFLRPYFNRPEPIAPGVWRSNQPTPGTLRKLARDPGLKTVLNLRGESVSGYHQLEKITCHRLGLKLITVKLSSRRAPSVRRLHELRAIFLEADRPLLLHCKSGADRAGLVSALYLLMTGQGTPAEAREQLSFRYLHIKSAKTGILDHVLAAYASAHEASGIAFMDWVDEAYDPEQLTKEFKPRGWANLLVDGLLRRE